MDYELAIIGGMGPLATDTLYRYITLHTKAQNDQEHINQIILSHANLPDRTEVILNNQDERFLEAIKTDFDLLNKFDLKAIAIPCNTSHYFFEHLEKFSQNKVLNMPELTVKSVQAKGKPLAILATKGTLSTKVYDKYAAKYGLDLVEIAPEDQDKLMEIIYGIKANKRDYTKDLAKLVKKYEDKAQVILACTELSTIELEDTTAVDALKVLGKACIEVCGREFV